MNKYHLLFKVLAVFSLGIILYAKFYEPANIEPGRDPYTLNSSINFIDIPTDLTGMEVNAVIEIPVGTIAKWEADKNDGKIKWEFKNGKPRKVKYLGYPANYGMIPGTLLSKENGGDGDPLDVIILGSAIERGKIVRVKVIGVLYLLDGGEQDDKLIAVVEGSHFYDINDINELNDRYIGVSDIIKTWFTNYKGPGELESKGYGDKEKALSVLTSAVIKL